MIKLGDDKNLEVASKGDMEVYIKESVKSVKDIYYTPQLKSNVLSVGQFVRRIIKWSLKISNVQFMIRLKENMVVIVYLCQRIGCSD